jgi:8-oxo-dGTP diphosphatase
MVTADALVFTDARSPEVLLIRRKHDPFAGCYAIPGGFVEIDEDLGLAAARELEEETGLRGVALTQLGAFGRPGRDPRGRVITVSYYAAVDWGQFQLKARTTQAEARWFPVTQLPALAFDHKKIVDASLERLRNKINYTTVGFQLLPREFTLTELQSSYEVILGQRLDKRNFRRKMLQLGILKGMREFKAHGRQRPARLYTFTEPNVVKLQEKGIIVPF